MQVCDIKSCKQELTKETTKHVTIKDIKYSFCIKCEKEFFDFLGKNLSPGEPATVNPAIPFFPYMVPEYAPVTAEPKYPGLHGIGVTTKTIATKDIQLNPPVGQYGMLDSTMYGNISGDPGTYSSNKPKLKGPMSS